MKVLFPQEICVDFVELVLRNNVDDICSFLTFDADPEDSLEELEEANALITPIMNYIRECKGNSLEGVQANSLRKI